jgi:hypothetical protein
MADFHQAQGDIAAHRAETGYSDLHDSSLTAFTGDDRRLPRRLKAASSLLTLDSPAAGHYEARNGALAAFHFDDGEV